MIAFALALPGCGNDTADDLRDAAEQSTPEAAAVLQSEADAIESNNTATTKEDVQEVLANAGEAQIRNLQ